MSTKFTFTEEQQSQLAGLLPLTTDFKVVFTPKLYEVLPEEQRPIFELKPWSYGELKSLANIGDNDDKAIESLRKKITGWSNLIDITGTEIEYESDTGGCSRKLLNKIPMKVLVELLKEVSRISGS